MHDRRNGRRTTRLRRTFRIGSWGGAILCGILSWAKTSPTAPASLSSQERSTPASRIYADAYLVWIYAGPKRDLTPIGYLRAGQSARLRSVDGRDPTQPYRKGCGRGWFAVAPAGFICLDAHASMSPSRYSQSMASLLPEVGPFPFHFALSMGTPSYRRLPTEQEWERKELPFGTARPRPLPPHFRGHEELVTDVPLDEQAPFPFLLEGGSVSRAPEGRLVRRTVPFGSMLAITGPFSHDGRRFLQSADGTVVPAERMRLFRRSEFEGVELGPSTGLTLPLGWPRGVPPLYALALECDPPDIPGAQTGRLETAETELPSHCLVATQRTLSTRSALPLSGRTIRVARRRFLEVAQTKNHFVAEDSLHVAQRRAAPGSAKEPDGSRRKWIHFRIGQGTLVTYLGTTPVFATLASPGIGGVPAAGADPLETRTTPVGVYRIQFKHRTDDMSPEHGEHRKYWIADVPFAQYFEQPFAIHVAYWHESFGEPMSGGCINVSPKDGARLFAFTDPKVPPDWYGVGASADFGVGTTVVIER